MPLILRHTPVQIPAGQTTRTITMREKELFKPPIEAAAHSRAQSLVDSQDALVRL